MQFIFIQQHTASANGSNGQDLLADVCRSRPAGSFVLDGIRRRQGRFAGRKAVMLLPACWKEFVGYTDCIYDDRPGWHEMASGDRNNYILLTNGRYAADVDFDWLERLAAAAGREIVSFSIEPSLRAFEEIAQLTPGDRLVGFSRLYSDTAEPSAPPADWPHHIFVRKDIWIDRPDALSLKVPFGQFLDGFRDCMHLNAAGTALNLQRQRDLLAFTAGLSGWPDDGQHRRRAGGIDPSARLYGPLLLGDDVQIGPDAVVAGPAILSDGVHIGGGSVVRNAILGRGVSVRSGQVLEDSIAHEGGFAADRDKEDGKVEIALPVLFAAAGRTAGPYRYWPRFSYTGFGKRMVDIVISAAVLLLFLPVFLVIALIIKLSSKGPVFYRAKRQGLHGKMFDCLKFRTMVSSADAIQDRLRAVNQVDGPQFKIANDPRISGVGRFLRDTCIDEIPQFINVLLGQMSIVGPRPSPEEENQSCPPWRDARLSVRPGITGLWQISRTRQAGMDFQEWIYYDMEYVRRLSLWTDISICLKTAGKLITLFLSQFG